MMIGNRLSSRQSLVFGIWYICILDGLLSMFSAAQFGSGTLLLSYNPGFASKEGSPLFVNEGDSRVVKAGNYTQCISEKMP